MAVFSFLICLYAIPAQIKLIYDRKSADDISGPLIYFSTGFSICACWQGRVTASPYLFWPELIGSIFSVYLVMLVLYYKYIKDRK